MTTGRDSLVGNEFAPVILPGEIRPVEARAAEVPGRVSLVGRALKFFPCLPIIPFRPLGEGGVGLVLGDTVSARSDQTCRKERRGQKTGRGSIHNRQPTRRLDAPLAFTISCCHHVHPPYTPLVRFNWNSFQLAIIPVSALLLGTGCSGINASGSVSPATFFLPGLGLMRTDIVQPELPTPIAETNHPLARSH